MFSKKQSLAFLARFKPRPAGQEHYQLRYLCNVIYSWELEIQSFDAACHLFIYYDFIHLLNFCGCDIGSDRSSLMIYLMLSSFIYLFSHSLTPRNIAYSLITTKFLLVKGKLTHIYIGKNCHLFFIIFITFNCTWNRSIVLRIHSLFLLLKSQ